MPRKPHPADLFTGSVIAKAVEWSAFTQAGGRLAHHFAGRAEAREAARRMADRFGRPALVYAIDRNGRSAVAEAIQPSRETAMTAKTFSSRFNAQRGARRELGPDAQEGREFRTEKRDGAWVWLAIEQTLGNMRGLERAFAWSDGEQQSGMTLTRRGGSNCVAVGRLPLPLRNARAGVGYRSQGGRDSPRPP